MAKRISWDEYFMTIVEAVRQRGTCDRGSTGSIIVRDNRLISTGYVGAPSGLPHCDEVGHLLHEVISPDGKKSKHCIRTSHSEMNAIINAAYMGVATKGATIYNYMAPCYTCAKAIINAGIIRVVCKARYHGDKLNEDLFKLAGVEYVCLTKSEVDYKDKK